LRTFSVTSDLVERLLKLSEHTSDKHQGLKANFKDSGGQKIAHPPIILKED